MTILNEYESKKLLNEFGINVSKGYLIDNKSIVYNLNNILNSINAKHYVIKIMSPDIIHKSDVGGVVLNISPNNVANEMDEMLDNIEKKFPKANLDGIYLQEMVEPGIECIIGIKEDPQFGKVVIFGFGGIYAEIFKDISMRVLPVTEDDIKEMITETKVYKILSGVRGKVYDIEGIIDTIMKVCKLAEKEDIKELDINPMVVHTNDCIVLDARILI